MIQSVGILGAGKLGLVLAQLVINADLKVNIAGSGQPDEIELTTQVLAPGAKALTANETIVQSDVVILALPLGKYRSLPKDILADKLVIDAMNYWWEVDGNSKEFDDVNKSTSELVREYVGTARLFKAFSHMGYHDLLDSSVSAGNPKRKAIAFAGDSANDIPTIEWLINILGFDSVHIGCLNKGIMLQPGSNLFGANVDKRSLLKLLDGFHTSPLGIRIRATTDSLHNQFTETVK